MKLKLERIFTTNKGGSDGCGYTIGKLYVNGEFLCDVLEDTDRMLCDSMCESEISKIKVQHKTAIPCGTYKITMNVKSPKYSNFCKYKWAKQYDGYLPRLINVKGYDGILIHIGNKDRDTSGCLLTGYNTCKGMVTNSTKAFTELMDKYLVPCKCSCEDIEIEIVRKY